MGNVIQFRGRQAPTDSDNLRALTELMEMEKRGELGALVNIYEGPEGNGLSVTGAFSNRLEYATYSIVKALNVITDLIDEGGNAGHSHSPAVNQQLHKRGRSIPRRLAQETGFGEL